ncbi:MAG: hypothetical protein ACLGIC_02030 [Acidimicrobiia bacterium]
MLGVLAGLSLFVAACGDDDAAEDVDATVEETETEMETATEMETESEEMTEDQMTESESESEMGMGVMQAQLEPLNDSGISGTVDVQVNDDGTVDVAIQTSGFTGMNPHAQHLHIGGENQCPDMSAAGEDGILTTAEGIPSYGEVQVSLTTEGDVGADSALAVERFPTPNEAGTITYERLGMELPSGVTAEDLSNAVVVQHGLASMGGDPAAYDGDMQSSLDPSLPLEATIPVACAPLGGQQ